MPLRRKRHSHSIDKKRPIEHNGLYPYLVRFLEWGRAVAQVSKDTIKRRESALRRFIEWCDERGIHDPREITKPILERYQRHLYYYRKVDGQPLSHSSQHVMLSPLKAFFRWLMRDNYITGNPASEMVLPKKSKRLPKNILHRDDITRVLNQPDLGSPEGVRDRTILEVLYATGMRRMELCNLSIYDIDHRRSTALIRHGKGDKDRVVPLGERALTWIQTYLNEVRGLLVMEPDEGTLFLTGYGEAFTRGVLGGRVKKIITAAGIDTPGSCHLFRHAMATHMLENGADIRFIQVILGHTELTTTQIYTQVSIEQLKAIHAATHPTSRTAKDAESRVGKDSDALLETLSLEENLELEKDREAKEGAYKVYPHTSKQRRR